jgi:hypothetical protein
MHQLEPLPHSGGFAFGGSGLPTNEQLQAMAWFGFQRCSRRQCYDDAVAQLEASTYPQEVKDATLRRAGKANLARIRVTDDTLRANRRRPGAFV